MIHAILDEVEARAIREGQEAAEHGYHAEANRQEGIAHAVAEIRERLRADTPPHAQPNERAGSSEMERRSGPADRRGSLLGSTAEASASGRPFIARTVRQRRSPEGRTHG